MREIKFRIWDSDQDRILPVITMNYDVDGKQWFGFQREEAGNGPASMEYCEAYNGDPTVSVMQFTGLKDKDGREIFEGDIVRYKCKSLDLSWNEVKPIVWRHGAYRFGNFTIGANMPGALEDYEHQPYLEVIGNIHENPELLA